MTRTIREEIFDVLYENLINIKPEYEGRSVVLCPICLREITREEINSGGVEHIISQSIIANDENAIRNGISKNQRCGITVLCRSTREINGRPVAQGCNGFKGSIYDGLFKNLFDSSPHNQMALSQRHRVAMLIMAYLGAFQRYGYGYILRPEFDEIREQFDNPDQELTQCLRSTSYKQNRRIVQVVTDILGHPFMFFELPHQLSVHFRRCRVFLPPILKGHKLVRSLATLNINRIQVE